MKQKILYWGEGWGGTKQFLTIPGYYTRMMMLSEVAITSAPAFHPYGIRGNSRE